MRISPSLVALGLFGLVVGRYAQTQEVVTTPDLTGILARLDNMEGGLPPIAANAATGAAAAPNARTKWAGSALQSDATGYKLISIPAGKMTTGVACAITIRTTGAFATPTCVPTGTPATGYTVAVQFTKLKQAITVPAVVLGAAATTLPVLEPMAATGVVTFDIGFSEPDVVGG